MSDEYKTVCNKCGHDLSIFLPDNLVIPLKNVLSIDFKGRGEIILTGNMRLEFTGRVRIQK